MRQHLLQPASLLRDYSPFGTALAGRSYESESQYRYGFQAQEEDTELWEGAVNYKYRVEDPRLGRFFSVDPLTMKYSFNSPYAFSENRVIDAQELEGLESAFTNKLEFGLNTSIKCHTFNDVCKENKYVILGSCGIALVGVAVSIYGVATVGTYVLKEGGEMAFEELTGIPVILDPLDMLEALTKQGAKAIANDVIMHGRTFLQGSPVKLMNDFAYNVKKYGQDLADLYFDGKVTKFQIDQAICTKPNVIPDGKDANHIFSGGPRKFTDNAANRKLISDLTSDESKYIGIDDYGKKYYAQVNSDGTQTYAYVQDGIVKGAGWNDKVVDMVKKYNLKKL
jgi:RHS repeat-associated protein